MAKQVAGASRWLMEWRRRHKLTQAAAANRVGLSLRGYQDQESGARRVSRQTARAALTFGYVGPEYLHRIEEEAEAVLALDKAEQAGRSAK